MLASWRARPETSSWVRIAPHESGVTSTPAPGAALPPLPLPALVAPAGGNALSARDPPFAGDGGLSPRAPPGRPGIDAPSSARFALPSTSPARAALPDALSPARTALPDALSPARTLPAGPPAAARACAAPLTREAAGAFPGAAGAAYVSADGRNTSMRNRVISKPMRGSGAMCRSRRPVIAVW